MKTLDTPNRSLALCRARELSSVADRLFRLFHVQGAVVQPQIDELVRHWFGTVAAGWAGSDIITPVAAMPVPSASPSPAPVSAPMPTEAPERRCLTLSALAELFIQTKIKDGEWKPATIKNNPRKLRLFATTLDDKQVDLVTRDDIRHWRDTLTDLDLAPNTINLHFRVVTSMFNWAKLEGKASIENPLRGLAPKLETGNRDAFTPEDLKTLFHSPLYTGHWRADRRERSGGLLVKDHKFWLPLIALHSGLRVEEAAKLTIADVRKVDDVWCFSVSDAKTKSGNRLVPVHPRLIRLGLLDHRAKVEGQGGKQLWPELKQGSEGRFSQGFVQWWAQFRQLIGLGRDGLVFHSFRHTFVSTLLNAGVAYTTVQQLAGHALPGVTGGTYGGKLLTADDRLKAFEGETFGVDLSHLIPPA